MIWLSLFDGMSCGQMAIEKLGLKVSKYYASEVDNHAIKMTKHLFPNTIHIGSVVDVDVSKLDKIDILIGGSPCQSFSFAGKRKGMSTKENEKIYSLERYLELKEQGFEFEGQSYLFWEYMRVLEDIRRINPNVLFLLENVEMGEKWEKVLTKAIGIKGIHINSNLVSAQNRKRIYWTNIGMKPMGLFGYMQSTIEQPKDKCIFLKDILESDVDDKYYLSEKALTFIHSENRLEKKHSQIDGEKSIPLLARQYASWNGQFTKDASCLKEVRSDEVIRVKEDGKSGTLCARARTDESCGQNVLIVNEATKKGFVEINPGESFDFENPESKTRRGRKMIEKSNTLMAKKTDFLNYTKSYRIRRLTPRECARLQTVSEDKIDLMLSSGVSDSQIYKMLGNGWTIEVICHIMNYINIS